NSYGMEIIGLRPRLSVKKLLSVVRWSLVSSEAGELRR
ncbi:hypothetical protein AVEN_203629-1, partial [Araneus ventricosus]